MFFCSCFFTKLSSQWLSQRFFSVLNRRELKGSPFSSTRVEADQNLNHFFFHSPWLLLLFPLSTSRPHVCRVKKGTFFYIYIYISLQTIGLNLLTRYTQGDGPRVNKIKLMGQIYIHWVQMFKPKKLQTTHHHHSSTIVGRINAILDQFSIFVYIC